MSTETTTAEAAEDTSAVQPDTAPSQASQAPQTPSQDAPEPATTEEPKADKPEFPKMVPVTALQAERQRRQQEAARARELEARIAQYEGKTQQGDDFPDLNQFKTEQEVREALRQWADQKADAKARETLTVRQQEQRTLSLVDGFLSRTAEVAKDIPQIGQAVQVFGQMEQDFHPEVYADIVADKDGPRIAWEIVTDPDFAHKLSQATPLQAGRLIDQRLAQAQKPKAPERPQVTATTTVSGAGSAHKDPSNMTESEWYAWRSKQK